MEKLKRNPSVIALVDVRPLKVDLDEEYRKDNGQAVIAKLSYNARDAKANLPVPQEFNFKEGCNVVQRLTDLRSSVNRYFDFCKNG